MEVVWDSKSHQCHDFHSALWFPNQMGQLKIPNNPGFVSGDEFRPMIGFEPDSRADPIISMNQLRSLW